MIVPSGNGSLPSRKALIATSLPRMARKSLRLPSSWATEINRQSRYPGGILTPKSKTILVPGAQAAEVVAKGEAEIGVAQTSEIVPIAGAEVLGPLPGEFASTTVWTAGIGTTTKVPEAAKSFIQFLTGPVARPVFRAKGFQPG